ncbi:MAG: pentapeptide repeat-containing protein [Pseudomonadota bacterium]
MLKHSLALIAVSLTLTAPSLAQNADHIAKAKKGESCRDCNLFQIDLTYSDISKVSFSKSRLRQSNLALGTFDEVDLSGADLSVSNLFGARFNRSKMVGADLRKAVSVGTYFGATDMSNANLAGANFAGADLSLVTGLTQAQLNTACGDASTHLPKGLKIPRCH